MGNREGDHGYDYRRLATEELRASAAGTAEYKRSCLALAQVYATLAVSAQMADGREGDHA